MDAQKETRKRTKRRPSPRAAKAVSNMVGNGGNKTKALIDAGYSPNTANTPGKVFDSPVVLDAFPELLNTYLPDVKVLEKHKELLDSQKLDHMTFPLGPIEDEGADDEIDDYIDETKDLAMAERTTLTDNEIKQLLLDVGCTVRRIVHGQTARHVYFWSPDNRARKDAVELAYKIKGKLRFLGDGGGSNVAVQVNFNAIRDKYK
jgi:hypothetical protein